MKTVSIPIGKLLKGDDWQSCSMSMAVLRFIIKKSNFNLTTMMFGYRTDIIIVNNIYIHL